MRALIVGCVLALGLSACGDSANCKDACDKLGSCGYKSSGISCDTSCGTVDATCAGCINDPSNPCSQIATVCATVCPDKTFVRK